MKIAFLTEPIKEKKTSVDYIIESVIQSTKDMGHTVLHNHARDADVAVIFWDKGWLETAQGLNIPWLVVPGDIRPWLKFYRFRDWDLFEAHRPSLRAMLGRYWECLKEIAIHIIHTRKANAVLSTTYRNHFFYRWFAKRSAYIGSCWPESTKEFVPYVKKDKHIIIGHFSYLDRTGSGYGLRFLVRELIPELDKRLDNYEVWIIGGGEPPAGIKEELKHPRIVMKGYVEDLESMLKEAGVVCMLNNVGPYISAYTRHLYILSLGLCLVCHKRSMKAFPEIDHYASVQGSNAYELAHEITSVLEDEARNNDTRSFGLDVYNTYFKPRSLAISILQEVNKVL